MFLSREEVATLTGRKRRRDQADQLRRQGVPFFLNAAGWPVVARSAVEGVATTPPVITSWNPATGRS